MCMNKRKKLYTVFTRLRALSTSSYATPSDVRCVVDDHCTHENENVHAHTTLPHSHIATSARRIAWSFHLVAVRDKSAHIATFGFSVNAFEYLHHHVQPFEQPAMVNRWYSTSVVVSRLRYNIQHHRERKDNGASPWRGSNYR